MAGVAVAGGRDGRGVAVAGGTYGGTVAYGGGTYAPASGGTDLGLGCGGVENLCFEPTGARESENWAYVGRGGGAYQMVESYQFVGHDAGSYDREKYATATGYRCKLWCICLLVILLLAGIGVLVWMLTGQTQGYSLDEDLTVLATTSEPFDCEAGYWNWEKGWSDSKKHWCCDFQNRGCPKVTTSYPYDCMAGLSSWQHGWSISKKQWCCTHFNRGCAPLATSQPYDCQAGLLNAAAGWSPGKKIWCCAKHNLGCAPVATSLPYDCAAGYSNWQAGWSLSKKAWCCSHVNKGCKISEAYDCDAGYSNWQAGWSVGKQHWCCQHHSKGCAATGSCSLWGDPHIFTFDHSRAVFYSEGDFWIVKAPDIKIQGRFQATDWTKKNDQTDYSSMTGIVVGGPFMEGHKIEVGPAENGKILCNGMEILKFFGTARCGPATLYYNSQGALVDSAMAFLPHKVVHMVLPKGIKIQVNRWTNFMNAKITMQQEPGMDGVCGNFNSVTKSGLTAGKELHAKWGLGVPQEELLFPNSIPLHIPEKNPSNKRCSVEKRQKAEMICHHEADGNHWSFAECLGDVCDSHTSTAMEMKAALGGR